ncbi:MAG: M14 family zinc carboxypeptidase [Candidatus Hodarchaeota archaeon]
MVKSRFIFIFLFILIIFNSIAIFSSYELIYKIKSAPSSNFSSKDLKLVDYNFIWEEYENAPGNQAGDDSLVFGPSFGPYHNYTELFTKLQNLEKGFPGIIDLFSIGKTYFGRDIYCVRITDEAITHPKTEVLIVAQHHAREQISAENALYFIDKITNDSLDSSSGIQNLLQTKAIYVIPSLNIDGAELMSQFSWQRKTARPIDEDGDGTDDEEEAQDINADGYIDRMYKWVNGDPEHGTWEIIGHEGQDIDKDGMIGEDMPGGVDPNRNYDYQFGNQSGASNNPAHEDYHGPEAFSENCTARFRDFVLQRNFLSAVSLHSGTEMIIGPWGWSNRPPTGIDGVMYNKTGKALEELTTIPFEYLYPASGEWGDWMYTRQNNTLLQFTIETYGNDSAWEAGEYDPATQIYRDRGVWDAFNPPANKVIDNCRQVYPGLLFMAEQAPYLTIQAEKQEIDDQLHLNIQISNPSSYVRTNCSIVLEYSVSDLTGLTLLNTTTPINLGELTPKESKKTTLKFTIDQSEYSGRISIRAYGARVGEVLTEYDLSSLSSPTTISKFNGLISMSWGAVLIALVILERKRH